MTKPFKISKTNSPSMFQSKLPFRRRQALWGLAFAALPLIGFTVFYFIPFGITIGKTFLAGFRFVGLANYSSVFSSAAFQLAAGNTFLFIGIGVPCFLALSLGVALLLSKGIRGTEKFRAAYALPLVLPTASVIMAFQILFDNGGVVNYLLANFNLPPINFLDSGYTFWVLLLLYLWKSTGYGIILMTSGLTQIPRDYYESARVDGASAFRQLYAITLPLMMPTFMFTALFAVMFAFKAFREAYALAGDYPNTSIYLLQHFMNNNFANLNYARLSVAALMTFIAIVAVVWLLFWRRFSDGVDVN